MRFSRLSIVYTVPILVLLRESWQNLNFFGLVRKFPPLKEKRPGIRWFFGVPSLLGLNRCDLLARQLYEPSLF